MSIEGKITNLFIDKAMTIPAFPRTKVKAISDDDGIGLNVLLDEKADKNSILTEAQVRTMINETLGVIENGAY